MIRLSENLLIRESDVVQVKKADRDGWPCEVTIVYIGSNGCPQFHFLSNVDATQWGELVEKLTTLDMSE